MNDLPSKGVTSTLHLSRKQIVAHSFGFARVWPWWISKLHTGTVALGWGRKESAHKLQCRARSLGVPYFSLEDGFICSLGLGVEKAPTCSLVVDSVGIYYDATQSSSVEELMNDDGVFTASLIQRAQTLIRRITSAHISKYNHASLELPSSIKPYSEKNRVLLVDQTAGDMSLKYGLASEESFQLMLQSALDEHPGAAILIKTHPDVIAGKKKGCFNLEGLPDRVTVVADAINPITLLKEVDHVYVATSQIGFEALMLGKSVTCFGVPFYAGWGLTDDRADPSLPVFQRRKKKRTVQEIFAAAYILYTRYVHPDTQERCELEDIVSYFEEQYRCYRENTGRLYCFGFTLWKRNYIRTFLHSPDTHIEFVWTAQAALKKGFDSSAQIVVWGNRAIDEAEELEKQSKRSLWRIEDGFIRSVGLGSDFLPPLSLVLDKEGIYYDPSSVSGLERILQSHEFTDDERCRGGNLREQLLTAKVSKYNVGSSIKSKIITTDFDQKRLLVLGQVEDDASIRKGCRDIKTNLDLLKAVRIACPNDYIIYKPHPDVVGGNRIGGVSLKDVELYADLQLDDVSITDCLDAVDEVHTMTSLVGFEGLLRGLKVHCYGLPFYAGWGLTQDRHVLSRRSRNISLDELVAATLILYPRYINWETGAFTTPEFAITTLQNQIKDQGGKQLNKVSWGRRQIRKLYQIYKGVRY